PQFKKIFDSLGVPLPLPTKVLLGISAFMTNYYWVLATVAVGLFLALRSYKKTKMGRRHFDWFFMKVPVFGPLVRKVCVARFSRTFSTLIKSGVPILGALEIVAATSGNALLEDAIMNSRESIKRGETLGEPLSRTTVFPVMVTKMISIGEKTGALEQLLEKIAEFYDQQVKATVKALTSLIEPMLIGLMGAVVGGIVLAIFLPILSIQEAVRKK
ncbi:MAG: type II secretion system F family protein, partial [Planctomycetota bacterium]|nr:type II secretion system F family protein [Planctomycetota bacterium]